MQFTTFLSALALIYFSTSHVESVVLQKRGNVTFRQCAGFQGTLTIEDVVVSPNPPHLGDNVKITSTGNLTKTLSQGAKMEAVGTLGSLEVYRQTFDMCEESAKAGQPCPVEPGRRTLTSGMPVPEDVPPGVTVHIKVIGKDADGSNIFCVEGDMKFEDKP